MIHFDTTLLRQYAERLQHDPDALGPPPATPSEWPEPRVPLDVRRLDADVDTFHRELEGYLRRHPAREPAPEARPRMFNDFVVGRGHALPKRK